MGFLVLTAVPDRKTAVFLAKLLVQSRLAACVSFSPSWVSVYRWKGKTQKARESLLLIKTMEKNFKKIESLIRSKHPYELPEIIGLPIGAVSSPYLAWLKESVK